MSNPFSDIDLESPDFITSAELGQNFEKVTQELKKRDAENLRLQRNLERLSRDFEFFKKRTDDADAYNAGRIRDLQRRIDTLEGSRVDMDTFDE